MADIFNPYKPNGFIIADTKKTGNKLERFHRAGASYIHFLFDFDRTLTASSVSTWKLLYDLLPTAGREVSQASRNKYLALEAAGSLSPKDAHAWSSSELNLHTLHGTNFQRIEKSAKSIKLREGSQEFFDLCKQLRLPTVILSAGIRDVIEIVLGQHNIQPDLVMSLKLLFAEDGRIIGWDGASLVNTHNKHKTTNKFLDGLRKTHPYTILVGDTVADTAMAKGNDHVLRIRISDRPTKSYDNLPDYLHQSFNAGYDMVLQHDLQPLIGLVQWLTSGT